LADGVGQLEEIGPFGPSAQRDGLGGGVEAGHIQQPVPQLDQGRTHRIHAGATLLEPQRDTELQSHSCVDGIGQPEPGDVGEDLLGPELWWRAEMLGCKTGY